MSSKTLIIYNTPILFEILNEIKENLYFEIIALNGKRIEPTFLSKYEDYIIISDKENDNQNCKIINFPKKLNIILEQINIWFLGNKFSSQSKIKVGNYFLDLNSRTISNNKDQLNLTEKETELILFIMNNKFVSLKNLQQKVWKHSSDLETHTVETHVYRLRKKFLEKFKDDKFINHDKKGYFLD